MRDLQPTVAGDMETGSDQPRFMDETVVVESKAVAIRARRATVHQRGSAPRHVVAATRSRLRRAGPRQKENRWGD